MNKNQVLLIIILLILLSIFLLKFDFNKKDNIPSNNTISKKLNDHNYYYIIKGSLSFSKQQTDFLAKNYNELMVKDYINKNTFENLKNSIQEYNPDFKILRYTNGVYSLGCKPETEKAYAHNSEGKRIKETMYNSGWFLMDLCSQEWKEEYATCLKNQEQSYPDVFDGFFVDDMASASSISTLTRIDSKLLYSDEEWHKCGKDFLDYVKKAFPEKIIQFNGLYHRAPDYSRDYLEVSDGGMMEGFIVLNPKTTQFANEQQWKMLLNAIIEDTKYNKEITMLCLITDTKATTEDRMFCYTSYLLIKEKNIFYSPPKYPDTITYWPEMNVDLGNPTNKTDKFEEYYEQEVYVREYEKGIVIVNPSTEEKTYASGKLYTLVTPKNGGIMSKAGTYSGSLIYKEVSEVAIPKQSGIILLSK
ncbi:hypothetical protein HZA33_05420 [Candidatus Pacearchaeota archaeon]|nr:hypothetical protein [Candidatus Pacearchaeota archaeon]